jgi:HK97 family phage portal protein
LQLLDQLRATAWTCASINASTCASYPPNLYVTTKKSQSLPKCLTQPVSRKMRPFLHERLQIKSSTTLEEVTNHPLLTLLDTVNPYMNAFDLWECTTLYQETIGSAFWYLEKNLFGRPFQVWPLPAQFVQMHYQSDTLIFQYRGEQFTDTEIIHFRYPDPNNLYGLGLSPLRAAFNEARMSTSYAELKLAKFDNRAQPDVVITPKEPIGEQERERLEAQWNAKFRRGGNGRALVTESEMTIDILNAQMGDLAALAEKGKNSEDITNAFHVPLSMLSTNTNLANLQASEAQHASKAIRPRLIRRDEKLNEQLVPMFDPNGRLYFCSDNPAPAGEEDWRSAEAAAKYGWMTINELRDLEGLPPVTWGDVPCQPKDPLASP